MCVGNNWSNSSPVNIYANYMSEKQLAAAGLAEQSSAFSVLGEKVEIEPKNYQTVSGTVPVSYTHLRSDLLRYQQ